MVKKKHVRDLNLWEQFRHTIKPLDEKHREKITQPHPSPPQQNSRTNFRQRTSDFGFIKEDAPMKDDLFEFSRGYSDKDIRKQLRVKKVCVEARLDLHGFTRQEALLKLQRFIMEAQQRRHEWILIITGKGQSDNPNTLRKLVPLWLEQIHQVNGYASAKQRDGGNGAYYVRIRKA